MRDAEILLCDINIALEKHPPWYVDRSPRGKDHRLLYASVDINHMGDEPYRLEG